MTTNKPKEMEMRTRQRRMAAAAAAAMVVFVMVASARAQTTIGAVARYVQTLLAGDGTAAASSYSFASQTNKGIYNPGTDLVGVSVAGAGNYFFGANLFEQRNGTNAQTFRVYGTYTDASNYERLNIGYVDVTSGFGINAASAGTGTARAISFGVGGAFAWRILSTGHFVSPTDNIYDIGASGARPRTGHFGTSVVVGTTNTLGADASKVILSGAPITVANDAALFLGASQAGIIVVLQGNAMAIYSIAGTSNSVSEVSDPFNLFTVTKDNDATTNIYYDAAGGSGAGYYIQNKLGGSTSYRTTLIGV